MSVTDMGVIRESKKEHCPYCGESEHQTPLACPRISFITIYPEGDAIDIHFWGEPDGPMAA